MPPAATLKKKAPSQQSDVTTGDTQLNMPVDQRIGQQGTTMIDLTASDTMDLDVQGPQAGQDQGHNQSIQAGIPAEQLVLTYLGQRFVSCRGPAVQSMRVRPPLAKLEEELSGALSGMVRDTTSLSVLVLGDPGSGKTLLVERAVASACTAHNGDGAASSRVVGVVRLSGLLHLEERAAFMELARQLCSEFGQDFSKTATFDENLAFLRNMLATLHHNLKAVVFVLDYFEKFARARGKQQLLYNLFDVLQHSQVQAAVIGVTCAQDVMESMEKRVRSRFSHRRMLLTGLTHLEVPTPAPLTAQATAAAGAAHKGGASGNGDSDALPITYSDTPSGVLRDILSLPEGDLLACQPQSAPGLRRGTTAGSSNGTAEAAAGPVISAAHVAEFNAAVAAAVADKQVKAGLEQLLITGVKPRTLVAVARVALDAWQEECAATAAPAGMAGPAVSFSSAHILAGISSQLPGSCVNQVLDLSVLQLFLVVGMVRLESKKQATYNFEMVWDECQSCHEAKGVLGGFTHDAAWRAFEELVGSNIAYWVSPGAEAAGRAMRYAGVSLAVVPADVAEALKRHDQCPSQLHKFLSA